MLYAAIALRSFPDLVAISPTAGMRFDDLLVPTLGEFDAPKTGLDQPVVRL